MRLPPNVKRISALTMSRLDMTLKTAFLMLEASHALGLEDDKKTLAIGRKMVDHGLAHGWDKEVGGVYDGGYYLKDRPGCTILRDTKNWWAQAET